MISSFKHIILECNLVKKLWKEIEEKLTLIVPEAVTPLEMAFGLTKDITKPEIRIRNWITFKLRETISKQEKTTYDKPHVNNEKQTATMTRTKVDFAKEKSDVKNIAANGTKHSGSFATDNTSNKNLERITRQELNNAKLSEDMRLLEEREKRDLNA